MARVAVDQCESCGRTYGERHQVVTEQPSLEMLEAWTFGDDLADATDGCQVEPDGHCPHGHASWLIRLGLI